MAKSKPSLEMVREFHTVFGQPINKTPFIGDNDLNILRLELLIEELEELDEALLKRDSVEVLDALCDLQYVLDGTFLALGYGHLKDKAMAEVHRSNMTKLDEEGKPIYREDGKILKGPNFSEPDLAQFLTKEE